MIKKIYRIEHLLFLLLCIVSIFSYSQGMTDSYIVPKWCFTLFVLSLSIIILLTKDLCNRTIHVDTIVCSYIIIIIIFCQALYGILQWLQWIPSIWAHRIVGSFDNPAGFASCLCTGLPFVLLCLKSAKKTILKIGLSLSASVIILAIILAESRSGMISVVAVASVLCWPYIPLKKRPKTIAFICIFFLLLGGSYFLKKESADGRLLIWKCSWEMIKESPIYGHGINSFKIHYMDYQADYFEKHPNSMYSILADNVPCPFSEYLTILLNFGFIGLFMLFGVIFCLLFCYYKQPRTEGKIALLSLLSVSIFSLFSYPFTYPFTWIIVCFSIHTLIKGRILQRIPSSYKKSLYIISIIFCLGFLYKLYQRVDAEYKWENVAYLYTTTENMITYKKLMPILGNNPYFLYNYAIALLNVKNLDESLDKALKCQHYWADYDLELLLGNIYKQRKEYDMAEKHYHKAVYMCPCRFVPLYQMFELYKEIENKKRCQSVAQLIIEKPVKVPSSMVRLIKYRVKQELNSKKYYGNKEENNRERTSR